MRSTLHALSFGFTTAFAGIANAQYPYQVIIQGTVLGCYPGQTVNIQTAPGTDPAYDYDIPVNPNTCTFQLVLGVNSNPASVVATTQCNGMVVSLADSVHFNFVQDSAFVQFTLLCGGGGSLDCNGVMNGPALPGTPCEDGDPSTANDIWDANCECTGTPFVFCSASFSVDQNGPWTVDMINTSLGTGPMNFLWWLPNGSSSTEAEPSITFSTSGVYGICLSLTDANGCGSTMCDTLLVDSSGYVYNGNIWFDCLGTLNGPNVAGTPCVTFMGDTGIWSTQCICQTNMMQEDCMDIPNGPNVPGSICTIPGTTLIGIWNLDCICVPDTNLFYYDCLGILNGPNVVGASCDDGDPATINDAWNADCDCVGGTTLPCQANFWVLQAYGPDSLPVPYELWVWNLSSGGSGNYQFLWNFGDGTSSTEPFPTHTYSGNGPYLLCLTIADNSGCTSTHCDSIAINGDGFYEGMPVHDEDRQDGFTLNVRNPLANTVLEHHSESGLALWPNPATDELNIAVLSDMNGQVALMVTGADGRVIREERVILGGGGNRLRLSTSELPPGLYTIRLSDGRTVLNERFVRTH